MGFHGLFALTPSQWPSLLQRTLKSHVNSFWIILLNKAPLFLFQKHQSKPHTNFWRWHSLSIWLKPSLQFSQQWTKVKSCVWLPSVQYINASLAEPWTTETGWYILNYILDKSSLWKIVLKWCFEMVSSPVKENIISLTFFPILYCCGSYIHC